jgi:hypothetical protein
MGDFYNRGGGSLVLTDLEVDGTTIVVDETNDRVGIGTAAPGTTLQVEGTAPYVTLKNDTAENSAGGCESKLIFEDHANVSLGQIEVSHNGSSDDTKGKMILSAHSGSSLLSSIEIVEGNVTKIGQDSPSSADVLTYDGAKWVAEAPTTGDITGVTAGVGLSGGGNSGAVTLTLDLSELSTVTPADGDFFSTLDSDGSNEQKTTTTALATLFAGTGLTASSSVIGVDAAQTQITSVGTIGTGTWQGTAVASAYLDADTAHLSGSQTFTGTKTLNSFKGTGGATVTNILDEDAMGTNSATALATQQSIKAYADTKSVLAGSSSITTVGTVGTGTWQGTAVASAYLDADTAHLSGSQTFTGTKTLNSFKGTGGATVTNILDEDAMGSDSATALATQQSIKAYADTKSPVAGHSSIVTVGTIGTGVWNATVIASAKLDADTAHLSGAQTFTGTKTLNSFKGTGGATVTNILDEDAMGSDSATALATQQSIKAYADTKSPVAGHSSIATVGTIGTGTWQGTAVASAYLDADTAHLSGSQTFSGEKTFTAGAILANSALIEGAGITMLAPTLPSTDHTSTGLSAQMLAGGAIAAFQTCCIHTTSNEVVISDADAIATMPVIGIAPAAISDTATGTILLQGFIRDDTWNWTIGGIMYASGTAGAMTQTAPSGSGDFVQALGIALSADVVYFNPSLTLVEVA